MGSASVVDDKGHVVGAGLSLVFAVREYGDVRFEDQGVEDPAFASYRCEASHFSKFSVYRM